MSDKYFSTKIGTVGGSIASFLPSIDAHSFMTSAILAIFGATISFVVSVLLKIYLKKHIKKRFTSKRKKK